MARLPMGKVLLRNVIRHTDAHNKIQEETEMWKMRDWEKQTSDHKHLSADCIRGSMHCDREPDYSQELIQSGERSSGCDDREARYWTRKLYEFEQNDPDRWGHSGFKELYPEEFHSDGEEASGTKKNGHHKMKKSKSGAEAGLSKRSKKSSRKKKKKKEEKKKRKKATCSSSGGGGSSEESAATKGKQRRKKSKSRHKDKKSARSKGGDECSGSSGSGEEADGERRTHGRKRRKTDKGSDSGPDVQKKRRKNWKAADESSDGSSAD